MTCERPRVRPGAHSLAELRCGAALCQGLGRDRLAVSRRACSAMRSRTSSSTDGAMASLARGLRVASARRAMGPGHGTRFAAVGIPVGGLDFHRGGGGRGCEDEWMGYFEDVEWAARSARPTGPVVRRGVRRGEPPAVPWAAAARGGPGAARFGGLCVVRAGGGCRPFSPAWAEVTRSRCTPWAGRGRGFRYGGPGATADLTPRPPPSSASGGTPPATGTSAPSPPR